MSFKKSVLIFGRSLNLAGIGACLKLEEGLNVYRIDPQDTAAKQHLEALTPEVIFFDLSDPPNDLNMVLMRNRPNILLIGVDPSSDEVFVFKGQRNRVVSAGELSKLISMHTGDKQIKQNQEEDLKGDAFEKFNSNNNAK